MRSPWKKLHLKKGREPLNALGFKAVDYLVVGKGRRDQQHRELKECDLTRAQG